MQRRDLFLKEMGITQWVPKESVRRESATLAEANEAAGTSEAATTTRHARIASLDWQALEAEAMQCTSCGLCKTRKRVVFGTGVREGGWVLVGEAPGAEEDVRGEPFVGQAGKLLDAMLSAAQLSRTQQVYILNVLKCRPPGNRDPQAEEVAACAPLLKRQLELLNPRLVIVLGRSAAQALLATETGIAKLRGQVHHVSIGQLQVPVIATYHPAYILRNLPDKAKAWQDWNFALDTFNAG
jgi:DNA polymerase